MKNSKVSMINTKTESNEPYDIIWMEKFVYPYGKCWFVVVPDFRSLHYMKMWIEFVDLNIGFTMKVTDMNQWTYVPYIESFWGHMVDFKNGSQPEFGIFNMQLQEHVMDSKDPKAKCSNYGTQEKYESFSECFTKKTGEIFTEILGCVPPIFGENETNFCRNVETDHIEKLDYHLAKLSDFAEVDGCKPPCHTITILSTKLRGIKQNTNDLNIMLDPTVTTYNTLKSSNLFNVMLEVGSSMGLWIGFSILQIFDVLVDTLVKTFHFLKIYNKNM